jgi:hypothetical protein
MRSMIPPRAIVSIAAEPAARAALEGFIAERFWTSHGARIADYCSHLLGVRDASGRLRAAAGFTPAAGRSLFLERYLDKPVEAVLREAAGEPVSRAEIVEVGNLAAGPGLGRVLIPAIGAHLHREGYRWVVFTATRELRNAFRRLQLQPLRLAAAPPSRLPDGGRSWGTYYAHDPSVMAGPIAACLRGGEPEWS